MSAPFSITDLLMAIDNLKEINKRLHRLIIKVSETRRELELPEDEKMFLRSFAKDLRLCLDTCSDCLRVLELFDTLMADHKALIMTTVDVKKIVMTMD